MKEQQEQQLTFIKEQANQWLVKLETDNMAVGDEERFVDWLEQDERHGEIFHQMEQTWSLMHEANLFNNDEHKSSNSKSLFLRMLLPIAATVLIAFTSLFWGQDIYFATFSDHYTSTGQRQKHILTDGSELTLNTDSAINIKYTDKQRLIEVLAGEIYVTVAPNLDRPFVVKAGDLKVTALGTEFIVHKAQDKNATVIVTEHSVKVESTSSDELNLVLNQGHEVTFNESNNTLSNVQTVNLNQVQAWRNGKYIFQDESLAKVIAELNRYYQGKIILRDDSLRDKKITGVLDLDNPQVSLNNLAKSLPIKINSMTPYLLLIEKS